MKARNLFFLIVTAFLVSASFAYSGYDSQTSLSSDYSTDAALNGGSGGSGGTGGTTGGTTTGGTGGTDGTTGSTTTGGTGGPGGTTGGGGIGCTRTQGYWGSSPAGQARLIVLVGMGGMEVGDVNYSASQLDDILDQPSGGNALLILAKQLIAAKLNVLNGADDSEIADEIAEADDLIGSLVVPPVGAGNVSPASALGMQMTSVAGELDDYNNGELNVPHCN